MTVIKIYKKGKDQFIGYVKNAPFNILNLRYHVDFQVRTFNRELDTILKLRKVI